MPGRPNDPARLEGEALRQWYLRTPDEIEADRRVAEDKRYNDFFGGSSATRDTTSNPQPRSVATDADILWVPNGYGGYRAIRSGGSDFLATLEPDSRSNYPNPLPSHAAAIEDGEFLEIGNPHNRRLRREYVRERGSWPRTPEGRNYDVAHITAVADGGTNTLDNIRPMHSDDHRAQHMADGDFRRWGARAHTNRQGAAIPIGPETALQSMTPAAPPSPSLLAKDRPKAPRKPRPRVSATPAPVPNPNPTITARPGTAPAARPPTRRPPAATKPKVPTMRGGPGVRGFGLLPLLTGVTGVLSGRIRTDTPTHFWYDMAGYPSPDDYAPKPGDIV